MKTLILALTAILVFRLQPVLAASSDEEARFVTAAKQAFEKHDADALVLLTCWDHVPDRIKQAGKQQYARAVMAMNVVITLVSPDAQIVKLNDEWKKNRDPRFVELDHTWQEFGVTNRLNLPAAKELKMTYGPIKNSDGDTTTIEWAYPVGEKDGKLYFSEPAPVK